MLLNHDYSRELGTTKTNLQLFEDNIGLRAIAEITDAEVIQKARDKKLRGWSFGFVEERASEEDTAKGMKRRYVEEMEIREVSIVDDRKLPCYAGTSITMRAEDEEALETRTLETEAVYTAFENKKETIDYTRYEKVIKDLGGIAE